MALGTAVRAFFAALFNRELASRLQQTLDHPTETLALPSEGASEGTSIKPTPQLNLPQPRAVEDRSDAVTLLVALQREARLIDLVKEDFGKYSDSQIGAAARPCLQQCAATLDRLFGLRAIESAEEGHVISVPNSASPARYMWIGEGTSEELVMNGKLVHHGWEASQVELPKWTGAAVDSRVISPIQVKRI